MFYLLYEKCRLKWYCNIKTNEAWKKVQYIEVAPGYESGTDYSMEKFNMSEGEKFDLTTD